MGLFPRQNPSFCRRIRHSTASSANLGLNSISLCKLPWDHMDRWIAEYLAKKQTLFAQMATTSRKTVDAFSTAADVYRRDRGAYPRRLDDLISTKDPTGKPYDNADRVPADPWKQPYQYICPGRYQPDRFDLYSWRGGSTDPDRWIGNWTPDSFRIEEAIEGEALLPIEGSDDATAHV